MRFDTEIVTRLFFVNNFTDLTFDVILYLKAICSDVYYDYLLKDNNLWLECEATFHMLLMYYTSGEGFDWKIDFLDCYRSPLLPRDFVIMEKVLANNGQIYPHGGGSYQPATDIEVVKRHNDVWTPEHYASYDVVPNIDYLKTTSKLQIPYRNVTIIISQEYHRQYEHECNDQSFLFQNCNVFKRGYASLEMCSEDNDEIITKMNCSVKQHGYSRGIYAKIRLSAVKKRSYLAFSDVLEVMSHIFKDDLGFILNFESCDTYTRDQEDELILTIDEGNSTLEIDVSVMARQFSQG